MANVAQHTEYAVVDAAGRSGAYTKVWYASASKEKCLAWARRGGCRVIRMHGADVGDRVHTNDIGRIYAEVAS